MYSRDTFINISKNHKSSIGDSLLHKFRNIRISVEKSINIQKNKSLRYHQQREHYNNKKNNWRKNKNQHKINHNKKQLLIELNKLSKTNYQIISRKIITYVSHDKTLFNDLIIKIFDTASIHEQYCYIYAKLCSYIFILKDFKEELISIIYKNCDKLYDIYKITPTSKNGVIKKSQPISKSSDYDIFCKNIEEKTKLIGTFQFIAELFKVDVIPYDKATCCIKLLINELPELHKNGLEEKYVECLCRFMKSVGFKIERKIGKEGFLKEYMDPIKEMSLNKESFSPRLRFLLLDCLERKDWIL